MKKLTVNLLTFLRIPLSFIFGYYALFYPKLPILLAIIFIMICATDFFDGRLARCWNVQTRWGAAFDVIADMFFVLASYIGLILNGIFPLWILIVAILKFTEFWITSFIAAKKGKIINSIILFDRLGKLSAILILILPVAGIILMGCIQKEIAVLIIKSYAYIVSIIASISSIYRIWLCGVGASEKNIGSKHYDNLF